MGCSVDRTHVSFAWTKHLAACHTVFDKKLLLKVFHPVFVFIVLCCVARTECNMRTHSGRRPFLPGDVRLACIGA